MGELETKYQRSPVFTDVRSETDAVTIGSLVSGKKFRIERKAYEVLSAFRQPNSVAEAASTVRDLDEPVIKDIVDHLRSKGLLIRPGDHSQVHEVVLQQKNRTFFGLPGEDKSRVSNRVRLVGLPFGGGNINDNGSRIAPDSLRVWQENRSLNLSSPGLERNFHRYYRNAHEHQMANLVALLEQSRIVDAGDLFIYPYEDHSLTFTKISQLVRDTRAQAHLPVLIGGDHSLTYPILRGLCDSGQDLYVIHLDAHTDLYHSALDMAFDFQSENHHGNFLYRALSDFANIRRVFQFGVRGINNAGSRDHERVSTYWISETIDLLKRSYTDFLSELAIPNGAQVYVTVDLDVMDPSEMPGVSTPVPGGLRYAEFTQLLSYISSIPNIVGADMVELNPNKDRDRISHQIASEALLQILDFFDAGEHSDD